EFVWMTNELDAGILSALNGKAMDRTGQAIPGTRFVLFKISKNGDSFVGSLESDYKGRYCFGKLPDGQYRLEIGHANFQKYVYSLQISHNARKGRLDIELDVGY